MGVSRYISPSEFSTPHDGKHKTKPKKKARTPADDIEEAGKHLALAIGLVGYREAERLLREKDPLNHLRREHD